MDVECLTLKQLLAVSCGVETLSKAPVVSLSNKLYPHCSQYWLVPRTDWSL